jgi:hypothetical protein
LRRFHLLTKKAGAEADRSDLTAPSLYPFTKTQRLVNDGVGFGEQVTECRVPTRPGRDAGKFSAETLTFRRTRSGKVMITPGHEPFFLKSGLRGRGL